MFDVSWGEMLIVGAVALVVIGPKDLPRALRTVGQTVGKLKRMAGDFQTQFQDAMREVEADEIRREVENIGRIDQPPATAAPYVDPGTSFDVPPPDLPPSSEPPLDLTPPLDEPAIAEAEPAPVKPVRRRKAKVAAEPVEDAPVAEPAAPEIAEAPKPKRKPRVRKAAVLETPTDDTATASEDKSI